MRALRRSLSQIIFRQRELSPRIVIVGPASTTLRFGFAIYIKWFADSLGLPEHPLFELGRQFRANDALPFHNPAVDHQGEGSGRVAIVSCSSCATPRASFTLFESVTT